MSLRRILVAFLPPLRWILRHFDQLYEETEELRKSRTHLEAQIRVMSEAYDYKIDLIHRNVVALFGDHMVRSTAGAVPAEGDELARKLITESASLVHTSSPASRYAVLFQVEGPEGQRYFALHARRLELTAEYLSGLEASESAAAVLDVGGAAACAPIWRKVFSAAAIHQAIFRWAGEGPGAPPNALKPLPHADESMDIVLMLDQPAPFAASAEGMLFEAWRLLRPGGRLVLTLPNSTSWVAASRGLTGENGDPADHLGETAPHLPLRPGFAPAEVAARMRTVGFESDLRTINAYHRQEGPVAMALLGALQLSKTLRGDTILAVGTKPART